MPVAALAAALGVAGGVDRSRFGGERRFRSLTPEDVRRCFPQSCEDVGGLLREGRGAVEIIKLLRERHAIDLVVAKRVYLAVAKAESLEEHQGRLLEDFERDDQK